VITQVTEHPAVLEACVALARLHGTKVPYLPVDRHGLVDPAALVAALTRRTVLVSIMAAINETGALQPIAELAGITREHGALFHCDAAQAAGKISLDVSELGVDMMTLVGHKMYAPKGVAASTSAPASPSNRSSTAAGKKAASAPAPRTSPSPSPSVQLPNSPRPTSPPAPPSASKTCETASTTG
jgi:cysteine sulfinate desulfinase/cysteine desulfurase-like protein